MQEFCELSLLAGHNHNYHHAQTYDRSDIYFWVELLPSEPGRLLFLAGPKNFLQVPPKFLP